jgi:hypothetical protein
MQLIVERTLLLQIKLTIDDGCKTSTATVNLRTMCTVSAVATIASSVLQVEFNSYARPSAR